MPGGKLSQGEDIAMKIVNVGFTANEYSVMENEGKITMTIQRAGDLIDDLTVKYRTEDRTAKSGTEYEIELYTYF